MSMEDVQCSKSESFFFFLPLLLPRKLNLCRDGNYGRGYLSMVWFMKFRDRLSYYGVVYKVRDP